MCRIAQGSLLNIPLMIYMRKKIYMYNWFNLLYPSNWGFPGAVSGKESTHQCRRHKRCRSDPWVRKIPWKRAWQPTLVLLLGESRGLRSLVGYSPWGHKESDMTEWLHFDFLSLYHSVLLPTHSPICNKWAFIITSIITTSEYQILQFYNSE